MDENAAEGEDPDQDIIQLLNAKKKNREILSITNAAVDAVSSREHTETKNTFVGHGYNNLYKETKENNNSISDSFTCTSTSSKDASFNGRHRVRVSSRLLREIKSPLDRSNSGNEKSSSETGTHSSSSLFTSQSSSNVSSIVATGPVPTVVKYSPVPERQMKTADVTGHQDTSHKRSTPVVIKYTQVHSAHTVASVLTENKNATNYEARTVTDIGTDHIKSTRTSHQGPVNEVQLPKELKLNKTEKSSKTECTGSDVNPSENVELASNGKKDKKRDSFQKSASALQDCLTREDKEIRKTGLCQGALSNNLLYVADSEKGQVKAVSFSLSEREKATREMLSRRQENKAAIRRVVQPKIVEAKSVKEDYAEPTEKASVKPNDVTTKNTGVAVSVGSVPGFQHSTSDYENQMKNLMSTLGAIETKCQETRVWQEKQQEELEKGLKKRDERRLKNLEDMQKQLLECQLKNTISVPHMTALPPPPTSSVAGTTEGLSNTQLKFTSQDQHAGQHPELLQLAARNTGGGLVQGAPARNPQYSPAAEHKSQPSFKTSVYSKLPIVKVQSGLKRKFVRNTRTQTSPQYSSSVSSSEMTSPLVTPLPRKRLPVPTPRDSKTDRELNRKHVHFDTLDARNAEKFVKRRVGQHSQRDIEAISDLATTGGQTRYLNTSHDSERQTLLRAKRSEDSEYIVNDIGKLRQELKDALKETERTKLSLKNLHDNIHSQISDEDILAPPDHTQPYPLDAYLRATRDIPEEPETRSVEEVLRNENGEKCIPQGHYADAMCILRDVQRRKETLESNLISLSRQHEEQHLYKLVDDLSKEGTTSETLRIRKEVAKKIEEIETVVQCELQDEERQKLASKKETSAENPKMVKSGARSTHGVPLSTERRAKIRNTGKENPPRGKPASKPKTTKPVAKQPAVKRPLEDASYVSRVYGRPDHVPRRTTVKSSHLHYQSPVAPTKPITTIRDKARHQQRWNDSVSSVSDEDRHLPAQSASHKPPKYYFQPSSMGTSQAVIKSHFKNVQAPLPGQLLSMAIPLGKPKTDPSLRLPVSIDEEPFHSNFQTVSSSVKQPNVAVITIRDETWLEDDDQPIKDKKRTRTKQRVALEKQVLPNVDIDTSSPSEVSDSPVAKVIGPQILPCPEPLPRPGASEYEEFKDYEGVRNLEEMEEGKDDEESVHDGESVISLHGTNKARQFSYQGPAFPPQNIPPDLSDHDGFERALIHEKTASETLENKAMEWIEQELLARVVSEMAPPRPDPTTSLNRTQSSSSFADTDDTNEPDLLATIGLRGIQLFVDAGIPVDNDLVRNLITEVLKEKVTSMIGYPKPQEELSPQEMPVEDQAEDESLQEESTRIETPVRTPPSLPASEARSHISTPDESKSLDSSSSLLLSDDMTKNVTVVARGHAERDVNQEDDGIEEGHLDDSVEGSPVVTPVVTPSSSPRQSIVQLHTPEVSDQDLPGSEKSGIETPEITVSIRDRTPVDSLQEEELKEQTLIEDTDEEEDKKTGVEIPVLKFELRPEPSEMKVTNSPSSITTTTYSTHSTMGTVATEDEISEGEQLQPFVHIGQYSEGEFAAPSVHVPENLATMHEIPDDVFDSFNNTNKRPDVFKHAVSGLLRLDEQLDETSEATEDSTSSEAQQRGASETLLSQGLLEDDDVSRSEGEVAVNRDVVAALLAKIRRQPLHRKRGSTGEHGSIHASPSVGELVEREDLASVPRGLYLASHGDLSPGEISRQNPNLNQQASEPSIDRPQGSSVFDSDENNNESERSSSLSDVRNQSWNPNDMVTPLKTTTSVQRPSSIIAYHEATSSKAFPPIVHVTEARHQSTPTGLFLGQRNEDTNRDRDNVAMETLSDIESSPGHGHVMSQATRIQLTLPSVEPNGSVSEGPLLLDLDETIDDTSSLSGGELP